jgi:Ribbon-helix-helix protein, copG family
MIRTQVSLDAKEYSLAKKEAKALGISVAEFVRRSIRHQLPVSHKAPWMRFAGTVSSGDPDSGRNIDDVVYGTKP